MKIRFFKTPWLLKILQPQGIWNLPPKGKKIYLTFDDGPIPRVTEYVLEQLQKYKAKATFFCVGDNIRKYPQIFSQILQEGHSIGNHTFNHLDGWKTSENEYLQNVLLCTKSIKQALPQTNQDEKYQSDMLLPGKLLFRPPYGKINRKALKFIRDKYHLIMWDVLTYDFDPQLDARKCLDKSILYTQAGSIVVFHDSLKSEAKLHVVLPAYLDHFTKQAYTFERL